MGVDSAGAVSIANPVRGGESGDNYSISTPPPRHHLESNSEFQSRIPDAML